MIRRNMSALLILLSASSTSAQQQPISARIDSIMTTFNQANGPGAQIAVLKDGQVVLERGYGLAQLEYGIKITPATVFHVASVSKQFTAFANVLLAQQGKLSLDDDIRKHLPELKDLPHKVTIRQLIHHTSGVRDQWELAQMAGWRMDDVITRDQIMTLMKRQRGLNFEPGSEHLYSNMGYTLLAEIVERVSGKSLNDYLAEHVFQPLGMHTTHVHSDHTMIVPNRAYSYSPGPSNTWRNSVLSYANQGATSLFTTAGDLARWLNNFETAQVGGPAAIKQMRERGILSKGDTIPYAFAIVRSMHRGREVWGHSGGDAGFRSIVMHIPAERLGVVVLSNAAVANPARVALAITDLYLGETAPIAQAPPPQPQQPAATPSWKASAEELKAYEGDYYSPELNVAYRIEARGDTLFVIQNRLGEGRVNPVEKDVFRANRTYRFERGATGAVTGFKLTGGRVRNLQFVKRIVQEPLLLQPDHPAWKEGAPEVFLTVFETSRGPFTIEVHRSWSPHGADRFYNLVRHGYYNDGRFHRVLPNYIVQWGLHGDPAVNRIWRSRKIPDDTVPQINSNTRGFIGFAMTGPNDRATQVYINLRDNSRNDGQGLVPFGRVIEGIEVVDSLYSGYGPNSGDGVRQGKQGPIEEGGNAYLAREYPKLDYIIRARVRR